MSPDVSSMILELLDGTRDEIVEASPAWARPTVVSKLAGLTDFARQEPKVAFDLLRDAIDEAQLSLAAPVEELMERIQDRLTAVS